jgi:hypothetical protein
MVSAMQPRVSSARSCAEHRGRGKPRILRSQANARGAADVDIRQMVPGAARATLPPSVIPVDGGLRRYQF